MSNPRFDHVGLTVLDLDEAVEFFTGLGLALEGEPWVIDGEFIETVTAVPGARARGAMLATPDGGTRLELSCFLQPLEGREPQALPVTQPGLTNVCFEVDDLRATIDRLAADGWPTVGGLGQHEDVALMAYVRGPAGVVVSLTEALG